MKTPKSILPYVLVPLPGELVRILFHFISKVFNKVFTRSSLVIPVVSIEFLNKVSARCVSDGHQYRRIGPHVHMGLIKKNQRAAKDICNKVPMEKSSLSVPYLP